MKDKQLDISHAENIDDVLVNDDIHELIEELVEHKPNIKNISVIWDEGTDTFWRHSGLTSRLLLNLERTKLRLIEDDD